MKIKTHVASWVTNHNPWSIGNTMVNSHVSMTEGDEGNTHTHTPVVTAFDTPPHREGTCSRDETPKSFGGLAGCLEHLRTTQTSQDANVSGFVKPFCDWESWYCLMYLELSECDFSPGCSNNETVIEKRRYGWKIAENVAGVVHATVNTLGVYCWFAYLNTSRNGKQNH